MGKVDRNRLGPWGKLNAWLRWGTGDADEIIQIEENNQRIRNLGKTDTELAEVKALNEITEEQEGLEQRKDFQLDLARTLIELQGESRMKELQYLQPLVAQENASERQLQLDLAGINSGDKRYLGDLSSADTRYVADLDFKTAAAQLAAQERLGMAGLKNNIDLANLNGQWNVANSNAIGEWTVADTVERNKGLVDVANIESDFRRYESDQATNRAIGTADRQMWANLLQVPGLYNF